MLNLVIANLKQLFRNKQSLFWTIAFPLIFTIIFGFFFSKGASGGTIVLVNHSSSELAAGLQKSLTDQGAFKIEAKPDESGVVDEIKKGTAAGALIIPEHFGEVTAEAPKDVTILYDPGAAQARAALEGYVNGFLTAANYQALHLQPIFGFKEQLANTSAAFSYFDFVLIGLLGMALMNSAIQGLAIAMARYRDDQILKRITTTPLPGWKFIVSEVIARLVLNVVQVGLILLVGVKWFHASIHGSWLGLIGLALVGAVLFQLAGFFIAAVAKNTDAAEGMAQAISIPMMFLSGVFFPIDQLPSWLYGIVKYLPLSPLLRSMRSVALESGTFKDNASSLYLILGWVAVLLVATVYRFRLSEE